MVPSPAIDNDKSGRPYFQVFVWSVGRHAGDSSDFTLSFECAQVIQHFSGEETDDTDDSDDKDDTYDKYGTDTTDDTDDSYYKYCTYTTDDTDDTYDNYFTDGTDDTGCYRLE